MTVLYDLPTKIKGFVRLVAEPDGDFYTIVLNSRLNQDQNIEAFMHEQNHIIRNDFDKETVAEAEQWAR